VTALPFLLFALLTPLASAANWPQWGGPNRNFVTEATLAATWPAAGPTQRWRRPLGDGFSAIVSDGQTLYTLYRNAGDDVVVALDAATGNTTWETKYPAPFDETCSERLGPAPRSAPLIAGDRLITVSAGGLMHSFDRGSGRKQWTLPLIPASSDAAKPCGYSTSPVAFGESIITLAGGKGRGVVAVNAASGREIWATQDFMNGYSSPLIVDLDGKPQLIVFTAAEVAGLNPSTGALEWSRPHLADYGVNVAMPVWGDDHLLFVSSAYNGGSRVLKLGRDGSQMKVDEVWANKRVRIHFGNAVRLGQRVYASNGDFGTAPFAAIDVLSGEMVWRDRSVARATLVGVGNRLIILDEDGNLSLATPGAEGLAIHGRAQIFTGRSWTVPTLVGTTLFLRDRKEIVALELGSAGERADGFRH
jgi:outer membrane protein assembly factor BamB